MTILIVDDEQDIASFFSEELIESGYRTKTVRSGYEAIDLIEKENFSCVVTDYHMAGGDGISLSHFCVNRGIPCVVITGFRSETVTPYLPKGITVVEKFDARTVINIADIVSVQLQNRAKRDQAS